MTASGGPEGRQIRVLVVEDNDANAILAARQLGKLGLEAAVAPSGARALELLAQPPGFALVLMDLHLGAEDGLELTREIRRGEEGTSGRLPIVAMTASATEHDRAAAFEAGMDGFLTKPVFLEALRSELARWALVPDQPAHPWEPDAPDTSSHEGPVDPRPLERMRREIGDAAVRSFVETYLGELGRRVTAIRAAVDAADAAGIERGAHSLRAPSAAVGAVDLARLCGRLEALAAAGGDDASRVDIAREIEAAEGPVARALSASVRETG